MQFYWLLVSIIYSTILKTSAHGTVRAMYQYKNTR